MKLRKKIAIGFGGLAAIISLTGCQTTGGGLNQGDIYSALLGTYASTPAGNQYAVNRRTMAGLTGDALARAADAQRAENIARAGKAEFNVSQNVNVGAGVNKNTNAYPFEVGKTYEIVFTSKTSNPRRVWNAVVKFNGFGVVNCGEGWEPAYEFEGIDGGTYTRALDELISAKPID